MRIIDFTDGFQSTSEPTSVSLPSTMVSHSPSGNTSSTTVATAIAELQEDIDTINGKVGSANGIASLDATGRVPSSQIPALAIIDVNVVADIAARDALTVQEGDVALVSSTNVTYIYGGSSWIELKTDASLTSHAAAATGTHGVTGNIVGTSDSQTLTNKIIDALSNTISNIADNCIKAGAAIGLSKLASLTANRALISDGSGVISASSVTNTELGYLSGATSNIQTQLNGLSGVSLPTGMVVPYVGSSAPSSWLLLNGNTIGSSASGATSRANADTETLFSLLWNSMSNADLPIQDSSGVASTRGANAAADFSANKRLPLPNTQGIFIRGAGSQTISSIAYSGTLGSKQTDQLQGHIHNILKGGSQAYLNWAQTGPSANFEGVQTGSGDSFTISSPSNDGSNGTPRTGTETRPANLSLNYIIKL